jgi:hypothetical protein
MPIYELKLKEPDGDRYVLATASGEDESAVREHITWVYDEMARRNGHEPWKITKVTEVTD